MLYSFVYITLLFLTRKFFDCKQIALKNIIETCNIKIKILRMLVFNKNINLTDMKSHCYKAKL